MASIDFGTGPGTGDKLPDALKKLQDRLDVVGPGIKGDKGDKGDTGTGTPGIKGDKGDTGSQGPAGLTSVASRAALKAVPPVAGTAVVLTEGLRAGVFICRAGTQPVADTAEGRYITSNTGGFYWEREPSIWGRPEWFGAVPNDGSDCLSAITAALSIYRNVELQLADYYISQTLNIGPRQKLRGSGIHWGAVGNATRVIVNNGTSDAILVGLLNPPMSNGVVDINSLALDCLVENIEVTRGIAPAILSGCAGVRVQWTQDAQLRRVKAQENMVGFIEAGTINTLKENCRSYRTLAGTGSGSDFFRGFHIATPTPPLTDINGNASTWLSRCIVGCAASLPNTVGLLLDGRMTDAFVDQFETAGPRVGIQVTGDAVASDGNSGTAIRRTNANVQISNPRIDQFATIGLKIDAINRWGSVRLSGGDTYFGPSGNAALACIAISNSRGHVSVGGGEMAMSGAPGCRGVLIDTSSKVTLAPALAIIECNYRGVDITNATNCDIRCTTTNETNSMDQAVIGSGTCAANYIAPRVVGAPGKVGYAAVLLGTDHTRSTADVSQIDSSVASGKLYYNNALVTAPGTFGTNNLAQGNFA